MFICSLSFFAFFKEESPVFDLPADDHQKRNGEREEQQQKQQQQQSDSSSSSSSASVSANTITPKMAAGRSPRKKLDTLLKMAEMRAAATENGGGGSERVAVKREKEEEEGAVGSEAQQNGEEQQQRMIRKVGKAEGRQQLQRGAEQKANQYPPFPNSSSSSNLNNGSQQNLSLLTVNIFAQQFEHFQSNQ